jgi:hypothetical protein
MLSSVSPNRNSRPNIPSQHHHARTRGGWHGIHRCTGPVCRAQPDFLVCHQEKVPERDPAPDGIFRHLFRILPQRLHLHGGIDPKCRTGIRRPRYVISLYALLFFLLPLISSLFFGRVFCGAACPLGAMQDLLILQADNHSCLVAKDPGIYPLPLPGTRRSVCRHRNRFHHMPVRPVHWHLPDERPASDDFLGSHSC